METDLWTTKHAPKKLSEIIGNKTAVKELKTHVSNFSKNSVAGKKTKGKKKKKNRAVLIFGSPGVGKTLSATLLANSLGLEVIEMNSSQLRNRKSIEDVFGSAVKQRSLMSASGKIILIDEVDGIAGRYDRGGVPAIVKLISESQYPIILTANQVRESPKEDTNVSGGGGGGRKTQATSGGGFASKWIPQFNQWSGKPWDLFAFLKKVCKHENITKEDRVLWAITYKNLKDPRAALAALQGGTSYDGTMGAWWEWNPRLLPLRAHVTLVRFEKPNIREITGHLARIAKDEGVTHIPENVLLGIASRCDGDIRAAINDLQAVSEGNKSISEADIAVLGIRSDRIRLFEVMTRIFRTTSCEIARDAVSNADVDFRNLMRWLDENISGEYTDPTARAQAYDALSRADVFAGRIFRRMNYKFLKYQLDLASGGVAIAKQPALPSSKDDTQGSPNFREPVELRVSPSVRAEGRRRFKIAKSLSAYCHTSLILGKRIMNSRVFDEYLCTLALVLKSNPRIAERLGLDEEDVEYVRGVSGS